MAHQVIGLSEWECGHHQSPVVTTRRDHGGCPVIPKPQCHGVPVRFRHHCAAIVGVSANRVASRSGVFDRVLRFHPDLAEYLPGELAPLDVDTELSTYESRSSLVTSR